MAEKPILIVHPVDQTTSFLRRVRNRLESSFPGKVHYFSVKPNNESHRDCLDRIARHSEDGLVIFLGHGRSNKLYGAKGNSSHSIEFASEQAVYEHPEHFYSNDDFINEQNIGVFRGKKVFCLACNSNENLAKYALKNGVRTFLGFGDIPTSQEEFEKKDIHASEYLVKLMKTEVSYITKVSLAWGIEHSYDFRRLVEFTCFLTSQRITSLLHNAYRQQDKRLLAGILYRFKKEMTVYGDPTARLT